MKTAVVYAHFAIITWFTHELVLRYFDIVSGIVEVPDSIIREDIKSGVIIINIYFFVFGFRS